MNKVKISNILKSLWVLFLVLCLYSCKNDDYYPGTKATGEGNNAGEQNDQIDIYTDKAIYDPDEKISFHIGEDLSDFKVRYKYLGQVIEEDKLGSSDWDWKAPSDDFKGYMIEVVKNKDGEDKVIGTVGVDVSSDWTKFPRYGFLSDFGEIDDEKKKKIIQNLNRYHINGIQFYDWYSEQQNPLPLKEGVPKGSWKSISGGEVEFSTVESYIDLAHEKNMRVMFYNLANGVLFDYQRDGVKDEWLIFNDKNHSDRNKHNLPDFFKSDIYLTDPSNKHWMDYLGNKTETVYSFLDFDGFHVDQLGERGKVYDYDGKPIDLSKSYGEFLSVIEARNPQKTMVMNAVDQFGQEEISNQDVDFLYTEVWSAESYEDLSDVILDNNRVNNKKANVLAAYMDYDLADDIGQFSTPGVLLTDAVIFAFGGAHIELGEHMLGKEYFPNDNLSMSQNLKSRLKDYYDFTVAYQNLLRDGGNFNNPSIISADGKMGFINWPPNPGEVGVVGKTMENKQIIHFINFSDATTMKWRDNDGSQEAPSPIKEVAVNIERTNKVNKVWFASPDYKGGASIKLDFEIDNGKLKVELPYLEYWGMVVIEHN